MTLINFHDAAIELDLKSDIEVKLAKVEVQNNEGLLQQFNVLSTPTMLWFEYGQFFPYTGQDGKAQTIIKWIKNKTGPGYRTIECNSPVSTTLNLVHFGFDTTSPSFKLFKAAAKKDHDFAFIQTGGECAGKHGLKEGDIVILR